MDNKGKPGMLSFNAREMQHCSRNRILVLSVDRVFRLGVEGQCVTTMATQNELMEHHFVMAPEESREVEDRHLKVGVVITALKMAEEMLP